MKENCNQPEKTEQPVNEQAAAPQEEAAQPEKKVTPLEELLKAAEQKRDEYLDMAQRVQAEFDNFRRRNNAARSEAWSDGARETVLLMLPVIEIDCLGKPFDPELENAVAQADSSEGEPGTVCTVLQKGYRTEDRVIRHAMVRVVAAD